MATQKRQPDPPVIPMLFQESYRFSFFKAVQLLERLRTDKKPLGAALTPADEPVRFSVKPGLSFPPSDISNLIQGKAEKPAVMEVAFMGLIGPSGLLPHWYNELAIERLRLKDRSMVDFFDIFHHRMISLFYLAWKKYRLPENYQSGAKDRISRILLSFIGLGTPGLQAMTGLPPEPLIFCSGLLSRPMPSAVAIESAVRFFAGAPAVAHQFIDRIVDIDPEDQTQMGTANGRLGVDAVCGSQAWENQSKFRIHLGPVGYQRFIRFTPSGGMLDPVFCLVRYMAGIEYEFEVRVLLKREEVPPCSIGMGLPDSPRLGWSTWIKSEGFVHDHDPYVTYQEPKYGFDNGRRVKLEHVN